MTILYRDDWKLWPDAIADDQTKNVTWVQLAANYKEMGVKHYYFHLALLQPELQGVDPFDEKLGDDVKLKILWECKNNYWYFMREIIKVPAKSGSETFPLSANRGNIAMFWCVFNSITTYVQQIRQTGKSLNIRALVNLFHHVAARNSTHILFTKSDLRKKEIEEYKAMRELLPKWMYRITKKDSDNSLEFTSAARGNITRTYVPQSDPVSANNVGRGQSPVFVTPDEVPFLAYADISIGALMASTTAAFDEARKKGAFHGICYTTTAGDLSTDPGKFTYDKIKKKGMFFSEMLFDCKDRPEAMQMIKVNGGGAPFVDISFNHRQLGKTDEWLREKIAEVPASRDAIKRDYLGQWTYGSSNNPIPEAILNRIRDYVNEKPIQVVDEKFKFIIRYHLPVHEVKRRKMVLGLDTSNAVNRDAITGVGIDVETGETLMVFGVNDIGLTPFAFWLVDLMVEFPNMTIIPENKSTWLAILSAMSTVMPNKGIDWGRRIYSTVVQWAKGDDSDKRDYAEFAAGAASEYKYHPWRNHFGFKTDGRLREELYVSTLKAATKDGGSLIRDPVLIDELSSLVERNNRIDHKASGNDDHVIAWLMAQWLLRNGLNLSHYGIDESRVLTKLRLADSGDDPKEVLHNLKQEKLQQDIRDLQERADNARTDMEAKYLLAKIKSMKMGLTVTDDALQPGSIAKLSADAKEVRREKSLAKQRPTIFGNGLGGIFRNR